jgi:hypothetical protein
MDKPLPVPDHIESYLGVIDTSHGYWRLNRPDGPPLQVIAFPNRPAKGATTLCTLGLSAHELCSSSGHVRQELLISAWDRFAGKELAATLMIFGTQILDTHRAKETGDVIGPAGPIIPESELEAILCLPPDSFPTAFAFCSATEPPTGFLRLVPVSANEASEVSRDGIDHLLSRWRQQGIDLLNLSRNATSPFIPRDAPR